MLTRPGQLGAQLGLVRRENDKLVAGATLMGITLEPAGHGGGRYRWRWIGEAGQEQQV